MGRTLIFALHKDLPHGLRRDHNETELRASGVADEYYRGAQ
jgi:hypothetical protein